MHTLLARIESAAARDRGTVRFVGDGDPDTVAWADLHADALRMASALQSHGVRNSDHVAILGPTTRHLVTAIEAVFLAGGTLVMLPLPLDGVSPEQ